MDEKNLIQCCKRKDQKAQRQLYDLYKDKVMGIALRYAKRREDAEDILQESFIKILNHIDKLQTDLSLSGWIKKVSINTSIDYYHRQKRHQMFSSLEDAKAFSQENDDLVLSKLQKEQILKVIQQLPDGYRTIFNLSVIDGYSHAEIAEMLGINEASCRSQLTRAKQKLKEMLVRLDIKNYEKHV